MPERSVMTWASPAIAGMGSSDTAISTASRRAVSFFVITKYLLENGAHKLLPFAF